LGPPCSPNLHLHCSYDSPFASVLVYCSCLRSTYRSARTATQSNLDQHQLLWFQPGASYSETLTNLRSDI
ncbi:MAG: hypothetical protein AAF202_12150, partial [Pseudomonadota bacterium]